MPYAVPHWVWATVLILTCAAALWRGQIYERLAALGLLLSWMLTRLFYVHHGQQAEWGVLGVDVALFVVLAIVALRSPRYWPIFAAGFQLLSVVIHVARVADASLGGWAYISAGILFSYLTVVAVGFGGWAAWRERSYPAVASNPTDDPGAIRR